MQPVIKQSMDRVPYFIRPIENIERRSSGNHSSKKECISG
jgi:hypothetical protein